MDSKYSLFAVVLLSYVSMIENKDIFDGLSKYSIVNPQVIQRWTRSISKPKQSQEKNGDEAISYALNINNRNHLLHLKKNRDFLHPNFVQFSHDATGKPESSYPKQHVHCYYHGEVEGYEDSLVALSTCSGLRGVIILGNETYGVEPVPQSTTNEHILYLLDDSQVEPTTCGVVSEASSTQSHEPFEPGQSLTSLLRRKRNLPQTSYVELVLVVDNLRYIYKKKNDTAVREEMVEMANLLDGYYKKLNIRVVLVGLEIFKDTNPFDVETGSAGDVLGRFVKWRKTTLLPKIRHDIGQLIIGRPKTYGNVVGMAFVGTVCSTATSGGINVFNHDNVPAASAVVAHEMGHNLGMNHDRAGCSCDGKGCIMGAGTGGSPMFSSCSGEDFEKLILRGGGTCLKNQPSPSDVVGVAVCGNGRLDKGEECDCGIAEECDNKCCNPVTCKLNSGAACAQGLCCDNCQIRVAGTPCRGSVNTCDLSEYCNGKNAHCPVDFYLMDSLPCEYSGASAYCFEGRCQTYDFQCKHLFAPDPATKADDVCFKTINMRGDRFGNCGNNAKCSLANSMCGKLQCVNVDLGTIPFGATVSIENINRSKCINADFNLGTDVLDPAYVNTGSPCEEGKICMDFKCQNASNLRPDLDCDAQTTCNGRGVCNDQGHCHCKNGWAPPKCDRSGRGGSIDSGPAQIDHSLRDGLGKKSRDAQSGNGQVNGNVPTSAATQPQVQAPPVGPGQPPETSLPISGFRYGELDYWNDASSSATAKNPAPRQGPGVPRPVPPRPPPPS
ncbi:hypothetical protein JOQ06_026464 [Pogonophryne albipinna]|uniref:Disintegrin and metalloproteinase domain-containing protein 9-like n=1 Tax=Pogonophryne albipinna TaxID=1090488 RepID=A0AAD6BA59_9TELE|nr:hypothetical protein JOQ06_026464 [Pogonophryne albipinna]